MHPNFHRLIEVTVDNGFSFGIASNGYEYDLYKTLLNYENRFEYITFSLDSHIEQIHDGLRETGSFQKTTEAITYFSDKTEVRVSICLNGTNHRDIKDYILFTDSLDIAEVRFMSVIPTPMNGQLVLGEEDRRRCCNSINSMRTEVKTRLKICSSLSTAKGTNYCSALDLSGLTISPSGDVIFCCDIVEKGAVIGSLKTVRLKYLLSKASDLADYLKTRRLQYLQENRQRSGFNTCYFCNEMLADGR